MSDVDISLGDDLFKTDVGIVSLHPSKETHWVVNKNEKCFDSYDCAPPQKLSEFFKKPNGLCLYSEYKIQDLTRKRGS